MPIANPITAQGVLPPRVNGIVGAIVGAGRDQRGAAAAHESNIFRLIKKRLI